MKQYNFIDYRKGFDKRFIAHCHPRSCGGKEQSQHTEKRNENKERKHNTIHGTLVFKEVIKCLDNVLGVNEIRKLLELQL